MKSSFMLSTLNTHLKITLKAFLCMKADRYARLAELLLSLRLHVETFTHRTLWLLSSIHLPSVEVNKASPGGVNLRQAS